MKNLLTAWLISLIAFSCTKDKLNYSTQTKFSNPQGLVIGSDESIRHDFESEEITVLGNQLCNPYSVSNMSAAGVSINWGGDIVETHKYVRFLPNSPEDLKILDDSDLELFDTPFDYEIITEGTYYHDPGLTREDYTWLYTVVPTGFQANQLISNSSITYEVLESLHLPGDSDEEDALVYAAFENCGLHEQLEVEDEPSGRLSFIRLRKRDVIGNVNVHNTDLGANEGLQQVGIVARSWFKIRGGYSDANGNFNINAKFRTPARVKMVFENSRFSVRGMATVGVWRMFKPNEKSMGFFLVRDLSSIQYTVSRSSAGSHTIRTRDWVLATMFNGAEYFNNFMNANGIFYNQGRISIWATGLGNYASAPMLKTMGNPFHAGFFASYFLLRADVPAMITSSIIGVFGAILGDVLIGYGERVDHSAKLQDVVFHELAHAYHFGLVGACYWTNYINYIVANGGYGDGTDTHANKVAVSEAFAFDLENIIAFQKYPNYTFGGSTYFTSGENSIGRINQPWIPQGLFFDLYDNYYLNNFNPSLDSTQLPLNSIFYALNVNDFWECEVDFSLIKTRLITGNPSISSNIDYLFNYHGH